MADQSTTDVSFNFSTESINEDINRTASSYFIFRVSIIVSVALLDLTANIIALLALPRTHIPSNSKITWMSMCTANLILGLVAVFSIAPAVLKRWIYGQFMCRVFGTFVLPFIIVSVWCLVILSIDRYLAISKPLHHHLIVTQRRLSFVIAIAFIFPFIAFSSGFINGTDVEYNYERCACFKSTKYLQSAAKYQNILAGVAAQLSVSVLCTLFVLIMILFTYARIIIITRSQNRLIRGNFGGLPAQNNERVKSIDRKVLRMLLATAVVFLAAWPPLMIVDLLTATGIAIPESLVFCTFWLSISSSWLQVLSLAVTSANFRRISNGILRQLFRALTCNVSTSVDIEDQRSSVEMSDAMGN